ncbi:DUF7426 family protein [Leifsonia sp. P73]|uniref:DUF7426 family protein n=1 Tax=Leifsonia sp. P73 TaxID=3423959 RepID=UPI003DA3D17E
MAFRDLYEILPPLVLPIGEKAYTVPFLGYAEAQRLEENVSTDSKAPPMPDPEYFRLMLGPVYDEMLADNVPYSALRLAAMTVQADHQRGRTVAQVLWEAGGDVSKASEVSQQILSSSVADAEPGPKPRKRTKAKTKES